MSDDWQKIKPIFDAATEIPADRRREFLERACADDPSLRSEVEKLLASFEKAEDFLENPAVGEVASLIIQPVRAAEKDQKFGFYQIVSPIGRGGMGEVYLARDLRLRRPVALKFLPAELVTDPTRLGRFQREARTASALNHPNVITIYEIGQFEDRHFIAAEFVEGRTLRERISAGDLKMPEILDIATQIATGLAAAHRAGIVHRDIKPENIMIRPDRLVKILDFGLAKPTEKDASADSQSLRHTLTNPGSVIGTVNYMSPEQAGGENIDLQTDLWSLGVCLFEMISGRIPFSGKTINHTLVAIMEKEPLPLEMSGSPALQEMEAVISKLLAKPTENRYQTAGELLADLRRIEKRLPHEADDVETVIIAKPQSTGENVLLPTGPTAETPEVPHNLQPSQTPLIGREKEIVRIAQLIRESRLVTLKGIGGTGKTRLARETARRMLGDFPDGVFFIPLADIKNPELVVLEIARPFKLPETGAEALAKTLREFFQNKKLLLVIDNFEQVAGAAPVLSDLLSRAPELKILVTSRLLLKLERERDFSVPPLELPDPQGSQSPEELLEYASIRLFTERARAVRGDFRLNGENAHRVAEICSDLEGLPLAIELAAARIRILSPEQIARRLENRLKILTGGGRDRPARQQTMRGALEWSYDLLDEAEKNLFRRLSVFAGGFDLEAAETVCASGKSPKDQLSETDILDAFTSLLENSLIAPTEFAGEEPRFRLLEVVREFALELLAESGDSEEIRKGHAAFFLSLAETAEPEILGPKGREWLDRLEEEYENIRAVMSWADRFDRDTLVRMAAATRDFWTIRNHLTEGHDWMEKALQTASEDSPEILYKISVGLGHTAKHQGDFDAARRALQKALEVSRKIGHQKQIAVSYRGLSMTAKGQGDYAGARDYAEKALEISRQMNDPLGIAISVNTLGDLARIEGDFSKARPFHEEALRICRELNNKQGVNCSLNNLGAVAFAEGDFARAGEFYSQALKAGRESGEKSTLSYSLDGLAALALQGGDPRRAARLAGAAEHLRKSLGFKMEKAEQIFRENYLERLSSELDEATLGKWLERGENLKTGEIFALALEDRNSPLLSEESGSSAAPPD
ncbi:MAG: protein kinase [Pyrinomonadaceae bacterium]